MSLGQMRGRSFRPRHGARAMLELENHHGLDVRSVREHVDGLHQGRAIAGVEGNAQFVHQRLGVARDDHELCGRDLPRERAHHFFRATRSRRIDHGGIPFLTRQMLDGVLDFRRHEPQSRLGDTGKLRVLRGFTRGLAGLLHRGDAMLRESERQGKESAPAIEVEHAQRCLRADRGLHETDEVSGPVDVGLEEAGGR